MNELREKITKYITEDQRKQKERHDLHRRAANKFQEDDVVMIEIAMDFVERAV